MRRSIRIEFFLKEGDIVTMEVLYGVLTPFLGTVLGSASVFLMKKSMSDRL